MSNSRVATYTYKLVLLGDSAVGKTSIATQFVNNTFAEFQESTIGAAFLSKSLFVNGNKIHFEIWDTAGQERYHSLAPMYYRNAKIVLVVYDITSQTSFESAKRWIRELYLSMKPDVQIVFIGNKSDRKKYREVDHSEVEKYCHDNEIDHYETSAKDVENIKKVFDTIASKLDLVEDDFKEVSLDIDRLPKKRRNCC